MLTSHGRRIEKAPSSTYKLRGHRSPDCQNHGSNLSRSGSALAVTARKPPTRVVPYLVHDGLARVSTPANGAVKAIESQEETAAALDELFSEESAERATWEKHADEHFKANDDLQQRLDSMESDQQDTRQLEDRIASLQYRIEQEILRGGNESTARKITEKQVETVEEFDKIPKTTYEALELFAKLWTTRIVALSEAHEPAKGCSQGSVSETWKLLVFMATVLWRLKIEDNADGNLAKQFQD